MYGRYKWKGDFIPRKRTRQIHIFFSDEEEDAVSTE